MYPPLRTTWTAASPAVSLTVTVPVANATWAGVVTVTGLVVTPVKPVLLTDRATAPPVSESIKPLKLTSPLVAAMEVVPVRVAPDPAGADTTIWPV